MTIELQTIPPTFGLPYLFVGIIRHYTDDVTDITHRVEKEHPHYTGDVLVDNAYKMGSLNAERRYIVIPFKDGKAQRKGIRVTDNTERLRQLTNPLLAATTETKMRNASHLNDETIRILMNL